MKICALVLKPPVVYSLAIRLSLAAGQADAYTNNVIEAYITQIREHMSPAFGKGPL